VTFLRNINKKNSKGREDMEVTGLHWNKIFNESQRKLVMGVRSGSTRLKKGPNNAMLIEVIFINLSNNIRNIIIIIIIIIHSLVR
jgi:hypothetical protein